MKLRDQGTEQLRELIALYDTDALRASYRSLLAEARAELERRALRGNPNRTLFLRFDAPESSGKAKP
jgi:hypothetical protein